jgi:uncharacterized membrane protein YdbT with pleckstrin-like domain
VAFPDDVLTKDEHVVLHLHPHWKALVRPVAVVVVAIAVLVLGFGFLPESTVGEVGMYVLGAAALVLAVWLSLWPFLVWRTTHYVFTNERVLLQQGVFSRDRRDIPLSRVNDHSMTQRFIERLLGCGTLTIESAGERGQSVLTDIPHVEKVQTTLYELVEADRDAHTLGERDVREVLETANDARPDDRR